MTLWHGVTVALRSPSVTQAYDRVVLEQTKNKLGNGRRKKVGHHVMVLLFTKNGIGNHQKIV